MTPEENNKIKAFADCFADNPENIELIEKGIQEFGLKQIVKEIMVNSIEEFKELELNELRN